MAKLCRSMCGVMLRATPARRTRFLIRSHNVTDANGVPRFVKKTFAGERGCDELGPSGFEVTIQRFHRFAPHRHDAFLVALADNVDETGFKMKLFQAQIAQFRQPQAGGVGEFKNSLVTQSFRQFRRLRFKQFFNFLICQRLGQALPPPRQR